ncbi:hypothetical protein SAMN05216525_1045 [Bradyrhizobium sp. Gha]|nr:hypothetical protein SAMN05216525_1045 [Bradyrhizobium sp. Gha]
MRDQVGRDFPAAGVDREASRTGSQALSACLPRELR